MIDGVRLQQAVMEAAEEGKLGCARAHDMADLLGVEPLAVGRAADQAGVRIARCQLGLFGYGSKAEGTDKMVRPMAAVPAGWETALRAEAGEDGLPCDAVWRVAERLGIGRPEAGNATEGLGLRVSVCQLGCFPRARKGG
jgi:hypothetical protein